MNIELTQHDEKVLIDVLKYELETCCYTNSDIIHTTIKRILYKLNIKICFNCNRYLNKWLDHWEDDITKQCLCKPCYAKVININQ